jgi:hypothetical protein
LATPTATDAMLLFGMSSQGNVAHGGAMRHNFKPENPKRRVNLVLCPREEDNIMKNFK